jgi:ElaB/YqjD/DUF883 family membrane-anchored ribosome-binding protein
VRWRGNAPGRGGFTLDRGGSGRPGRRREAARAGQDKAEHGDRKDDIDQLRQGLEELRGSVASLTARLGEGAASAGSRGLQQVRQAAGAVTDSVADRAGEGVATLRGGVEAQPLASLAMAFLVGVVLGSLLTSSGGGNRR